MPPGTRRQQKECSKQMITDIVLQATAREELGKNAARRLRASGRIPVSVYGLGGGTVAASINARPTPRPRTSGAANRSCR